MLSWENVATYHSSSSQILYQSRSKYVSTLINHSNISLAVTEVITCYALFLKSDWLVALLFLLKYSGKKVK